MRPRAIILPERMHRFVDTKDDVRVVPLTSDEIEREEKVAQAAINRLKEIEKK